MGVLLDKELDSHPDGSGQQLRVSMGISATGVPQESVLGPAI